MLRWLENSRVEWLGDGAGVAERQARRLAIAVAPRRTRARETVGHRRGWCADRDAVAPVAVDPVEAVLDVGAGVLGKHVAWQPGRGAVAEALAFCGREMRLETVENRVRAGAGLERLHHHDAQRH